MAELGKFGSSTSVTLQNWKRMSNALVELPNVCAVYWRDYVVVMDVGNGECLLFNVRWNMWSRLEPKIPQQPANGCPLACFNDKLLAVGADGTMYEFLSQGSRWERSKTFDTLVTLLKVGESSSSGQFFSYVLVDSIKQRLLTAHLTCSEGTLFYIHSIKEEHYQGGILSKQQVIKCMMTHDGTSWSLPSTLNCPTQNQDVVQSVALQGSNTIYLNTHHAMFAVQVPSHSARPAAAASTNAGLMSSTPAKPKKLDVVARAAPPLQMSSLSVVNGHLFAFGGKDQDSQPFTSVYCYCPGTNSWQAAGSMLSSRYGVAIAVIKQEEGATDVYAVGGYLGESSQAKLGCRIIECCSCL